MNRIRIKVALTLMVVLLTACNFNYSQSGLKAKDYEKELALAKKTLRFISENESDSLLAMFNPKIRIGINQKTLDWLMSESQNILDNYNYPEDLSITVNETNSKSLLGETIYREFVFPFEKEESKDSTKYLKITFVDNELHKFMISSGFQFMH